jgi:hypothetical protein
LRGKVLKSDRFSHSPLAARIERNRQARQRKRDVRDPEVEDRQQVRRQLRARVAGMRG